MISVDGLVSYVTAVRRVFRQPVHTGQPGRPRLIAEVGVLLGHVVKRHARCHLVAVERRVVQGTWAAIQAVLAETGTGSGINTADIERLNATFRGRWPPWPGAAADCCSRPAR